MNATNDRGIVTRMWLHMLANGGRWGVSELIEKLQISSMPRKRVDVLVNQMADRQQVVKYVDSSRANGVAFGVTSTCIIPTQIPVREVAAALQPAPERESA